MKPVLRPLPLAALSARPAHVDALKALAHLSRLQAFFFLVRKGDEVPAGEIQEALKVPGPTLSHHLDVLRRAGLVQSRKEERFVYYSVRRDTAMELVRLLTACC
jgi:DNA-binding transcriptional ArsR family regulator